jgi:hypothetical protein
MVTWNGQSGFAIARNLDIGGTRQGRTHRTAPRYAGAPPGPYEAEPPVVYGPPVYYGPPPVVYGSGYYYGVRDITAGTVRDIVAGTDDGRR